MSCWRERHLFALQTDSDFNPSCFSQHSGLSVQVLDTLGIDAASTVNRLMKICGELVQKESHTEYYPSKRLEEAFTDVRIYPGAGQNPSACGTHG